MSDDNMSHSQVESLLRAMRGGVDSTAAGCEVGAAASKPSNSPAALSAAAEQPSRPTPEFAAYDFKQRQRVGAEQMQAVRSLHETIAHQFSGVASSLLRSVVQCRLLSASQRTYGEFIAGLENPSCLHVLTVDPREGRWLLDVTPPLAYAVVDRLLGGDAEPGCVFRRAMTEIETHLVRRLVNLFLTQAMRAWQPVAALQLAIERVESEPQLALIVPPNEVVIAVALEVTLGRNRGLMNLCIPASTVAGLDRRLSGTGVSESAEPQPTEVTRQTIATNIDLAAVELAVTLAQSTIRTAELLDLTVGDVITTEQEVSSPMVLSVQGMPKFLVRPGAYRGKKAICIQGLISS